MMSNRCWKLSAAWLLLALRLTISKEIYESDYIVHNYSRKTTKPGSVEPPTDPPEVCDDYGEVELRLSGIGMHLVGANVVTSKRVAKLYLDDNGITEVSSCAFSMVPNLRLLNLSLNNISTPQMLRIGGHKELRQLIVDNNQRRDQNSALEETLDCLPRLEELSLRSGGISRFAVDLNKFAPVLVRLNLSGNKIESAAFLKNAPKNLKIVDLSDNLLSKIDKGFLSNVQELVVAGNAIKELCGESCGASSLSVRGMVHLETLNASRNAIAKVAADAFDDSSKLRLLDLSANELDSLDQIRWNGPRALEELFAAKNHLTTVPNVCSLRSLKILDIAGNLIEAVTKDSFCPQGIPLNLRVVNLADNKIMTVDSKPFKFLVVLHDLNLSNNRIRTFPNNLINDSSLKLRRLSMKNNLIDSLENLSGEKSYSLQELHLQDNPLLFFNVAWISRSQLPNLVIYLKDHAREHEKPTAPAKDKDEDKDEDSDFDECR